MEIPVTTAAIQWSLDCAILYITVAAMGIAIVGFLYKYFNREENDLTDNTRIGIKIDHRGNHKYESIPDAGNDAMVFWWRLIMVVVALILLFIPLNAYLNRY
jgi:hypothetical protein